MPWDVIISGGPDGLFVLTVVAILFGWLVYRPVLRAVEKHRDRWLDLYLKEMGGRSRISSRVGPT